MPRVLVQGRVDQVSLDLREQKRRYIDCRRWNFHPPQVRGKYHQNAGHIPRRPSFPPILHLYWKRLWGLVDLVGFELQPYKILFVEVIVLLLGSFGLSSC